MDEARILGSMEWWHVLGGLIATGLAMFGVVFKLSSRALQETTDKWTTTLESFAVRQASHEKRLEEYTRMIHQAQLSMIDRISRVEGRIEARVGGGRWHDPDSHQ